jgi:monofunctional biosynthetic peptidoglycan transglycosylase
MPPGFVSKGAADPAGTAAVKELLTSLRLSFLAAARFLAMVTGLSVAVVLIVLLVLRFIDPPMSAVMLRDAWRGARVEQQWVPLERISPELVRAVISSEDARFCSHWGIDFRELNRAIREAGREGLGRARGASTLTMQVAKNLFLWTDRSVLRKSLELVLTPLIELAWSKRRIVEVYLNIAQWGRGVFGAEAAARRYFNKGADELDAREASLLAASLPAPGHRRPANAGPRTRSIAARVRSRMASPYVDYGCVLEREEAILLGDPASFAQFKAGNRPDTRL